MNAKILFGGLAAICAAPASACYNGPMPVQFAGLSATLTPDDKSWLDWQIHGHRTEFPQSRLLVLFYRTAPRALFDERRQAVRNYLIGHGVKPTAIAIEAAHKRPSADFLAGFTQGKVPAASVELTFGGCH